MLEEASPDRLIREAARRVGVSPTAAYRHFDSKEDLLASVAAEGFRELTAAMKAEVESRRSASGVGPAYMEFALQKRGLFRLMFGPLLAERAKYPALNESVNEALKFLRQVTSGAQAECDDDIALLAAWGLVHGLSMLCINGLVPESRARDMAVPRGGSHTP
jgi:AcrR family transcriptional regulator